MSKSLAATILGMALAIQATPSTQTTAAPGWQRFRVTAEHFSVLLPSLPVVVQRGQYGKQPIGIPPFGLPARKAANSYAAYADGVVYLLIYFDNPKHENSLEYFLDEQLSRNELRNTQSLIKNETSENGRRVLQFEFEKLDYRKTASYPGTMKVIDDKDRALALLAIGKKQSDEGVARFLKSLDVSNQPEGADIGKGGTNATTVMETPDQIISPITASVRAMIILKPEPRYSQVARQKKLTGTVSLKAVLSATGQIANLEVVSGLPELAASALDAAGKIVFIPAVKDGHFVSTAVELEYNFNLY